MKKIFLTLLFFVLALGMQASVSDLFKIDDAALSEEFASLNQLEEIVVGHSDITFESLMAEHSDLMNSIHLQSDLINGLMGFYLEPPLGIPSFVWGFCLGIAGIAVVYFVTEEKEETKKALWGCIAGSALYTAVYVVYYVIILSSL